MPPGPSSRTAPPYLPAGYHMSAFPGYPKIATHKINTAYRSNQGLVATKAGLHSKPAKVEVSNAHWKDLEKKEELLDYLEDGTEVIVFNEACGYHGLWAEVIVVGENGFHTYQDSEVVDGAIISSDLKRQFVMFSDLEKLPGIQQSHPMVEPSQIKSFNYDILPSPWRNKTPEVPFYDTRTANISVVVERDPTVWAADENTQTLMRKALEEGLRIIFEHYQKEIPEGLFPELDVLARDTSQYDEFFIFARAEEFHLEARPNAPLKVLVTIPQKYFDTYDVKEEAQPLVSKFKDKTAEAKATLNKYLDSNSGLLNTSVLRELLDDEAVRDVFGHDALAHDLGIFGEEIVFLEKNGLATSITDPEALNARSQERMAQANDEIGGLPESYYEKYVSEDIRESIENTIDTVGDALANLETDANELTAAAQNAIDIVNKVQQTLGAAPEYDATNQALMSSLTDPTVSMGDLTGTFEKEIQKRKFADQDLDTVLPKIKGTLLEKQYHNLIKNFGAAVREVALLANPSFQPIHKAEKTQKAKENQRAALQAVEDIEKTIKKVKFYVHLSTDQFKEGTDQLKKILEYLEESKDQFQGEVKGWSPYADANRITEAYDEVVEYITDQGENNNPKIKWRLPNNHELFTGAGPYVEIAFTNAHSMVYMGYSAYSDSHAKWLTMHRYNTGQMLPTPPRPSPLDSETIMAYVWKLNDIVNDPLSNYLMGKPLPLTRWGLKYVYPRPTFIPKPRKETDISDERHKNKTLLNQLDQKEMQLHRKNAEKVARIALEATYAIEEPIDTVVASSNEAIRYVNRTDDWINNFFESVSTNDPYSAALVKCLVPNLDFDLLPEIPDFDLQFLRNPILKLLELYNLLAPKGDLLQGIYDGLLYLLEQLLKILYVTIIKLLLETLTALCLQFQAGLLNAIAAAIDPQPSDLISDDAASDISITGVTPNQAALRESTTLKTFQEIGVFPLQGFNEVDSLQKIRVLFTDVSGMLSAVEICQLTSGNPPQYIVDIVKSLIELKHQYFIDVLGSKSKIIDLFTAFGKYVDQKLCDDIIKANEANTIYNNNYKDLYCNISTELDQARKSLLSCKPGLTPAMVDDIVARENKNNLEVAKNVINSFNSDSIKDLLQPLSMENEAVDFANGLAIETMFEPASIALKQELSEFPKYLRKVAESRLRFEHGLLPNDELPPLTEIAKTLREQYKNIESNEVFQISESEPGSGFTIKLRSPATQIFTPGAEAKTFELLYKLHNKNTTTDPAFTNFAAALSGQPLSIVRGVGEDKYSLILRDPETSENLFTYTKKFNPSESVKNYIEQNFQNVDFTSLTTTPQQKYFSELMFSKMPAMANIIIEPGLTAEQSITPFIEYGVFSQITRDVIAFLGRQIAGSRYFDVHTENPLFGDMGLGFFQELGGNAPDPTKDLSNLEKLDFFSHDFLNLENIKSEALKKFKKNYHSDLPEPSDGTIQRKSYNSFEVANLEQCIKSIIRVYILEFFAKSIFSNDVFELSEETEEILYDYILFEMKKDIPLQFSRIFNYKFFYLARGIYQDDLETPFAGDDYGIDKAMKKYIIEQYNDVASTFNQMIIEAGGWGGGVTQHPKTAKEIFLDQLPVRGARSSYATPEEFIGEDDEKLKNGNFYFEKYVRILKQDGTSKIYAPADLTSEIFEKKVTLPSGGQVYDVSEIFYGLRLVYLFPYGDVTHPKINVTKPEEATWDDPKYSINLQDPLIAMAESRDYETTTMLEKIPWMGPTLDESAPHGHKRFAHVVTIISVEQKYDGNRESFLEAYSGPTSVDTAYGDSPGDWWHSKTYNKLGYEIIDEHRQVLKDELVAKINIELNNSVSKRFYLANYLEQNGLGLSLMVNDVEWPSKSAYWFTNIASKEQADPALRPDSEAWSVDGSPASGRAYRGLHYQVLKNPSESIEEYIDRFLIDFYSKFEAWVYEYESDEVEFVHMYAMVDFPTVIQTSIGIAHPDDILRSQINNNEELNFLFDYIFPIEKYKTLMSIYGVEAMSDIPGLDIMFSETQAELRGIFNTMDSRGRFNYTDTIKVKSLEKIRNTKTGIQFPSSEAAAEEAAEEETGPTIEAGAAPDIPDYGGGFGIETPDPPTVDTYEDLEDSAPGSAFTPAASSGDVTETGGTGGATGGAGGGTGGGIGGGAYRDE